MFSDNKLLIIFGTLPAVFMIQVFSSMYTVYRVSAFDGVGTEPPGVTWGQLIGGMVWYSRV